MGTILGSHEVVVWAAYGAQYVGFKLSVIVPSFGTTCARHVGTVFS